MKYFFHNKKNQLICNDIIYIHGYSASKNDHDRFKKIIEKKGYKFHSFDLPGHGERKNKDNPEDINFENFLKTIKDYINNLNLKKFIIFGHSMGGALTMAIYPEFANKIHAVILEDPHNPSIFRHSLEDIKKSINVLKDNYFKKDKKNKETKVSFLKIAKDFYESKSGYYKLLLNIVSPSSIKLMNEGAEQIFVPTLLVMGENDPVIPLNPTINFMMKKIDNLKVNVIKNARHVPSNQCPKEFDKVILDFLNKINIIHR